MKIKHWLMSFLLLKIAKNSSLQAFLRVIKSSDNHCLIDHKPNDNTMVMIAQIPSNLAFQNFFFS